MKYKIKAIRNEFNVSSYFNALDKFHYSLFSYYDIYISFFLSKMVRDGKKEFYYHIFLKMIHYLRLLTRGLSPLFLMRRAIYNSKPLLGLRCVSKKKIGSFRPVFYSVDKQIKSAIGFILESSNSFFFETGRTYYFQQLSMAVLNCFFKVGPVFVQLEEMYSFLNRKVETNRITFSKSIPIHVHLRTQSRRPRKEIGFFLRNRYSLPYWIRKS